MLREICRLIAGSAICLSGGVLLAQEAPAKPAEVEVKEIQVIAVGAQPPATTGDAEAATKAPSPPDQPPNAVNALVALPVPNHLGHAVDHLIVSLVNAADSEVPGKYWVGVSCNNLPEALRVQLDLPADVGLLVDEVTDGSPAMKAGIQKHDLLMAVSLTKQPTEAAKPLKNRQDLVAQVQSAENSPIKIELLRRGRKQVLEVIPVERPVIQTTVLPSVPGQPLAVNAYTAIQAHVPTFSPDPKSPTIAKYYAGPMIVQVPMALPEGMSITFTSPTVEGTPETVSVKKGDQSWTLPVTELDKLPEDVRPLVLQNVAARQAAKRSSVEARLALSNPHGQGNALPDDATVTIVRHGGEPAKITIKKGDQSWDAVENSLQKLPDEIRKYAEVSLPPSADWFRSRAVLRAVTSPAAKTEAHAVEYQNMRVQSGANTHPADHVRRRALSEGAFTVTRPETKERQTITKEYQATQPVEVKVRTVQPPVLAPTPDTVAPHFYARTTQAVRPDIERQLKELSEKVDQLKELIEKSNAK